MTFPHKVVRQQELGDQQGHRAILAIAIARQADSQTARAVAKLNDDASDSNDAINERIHYFGAHNSETATPSGAFGSSHRIHDTVQSNCKNGVYQDASMNCKAHGLNGDWTREQFNQTGQEASRTL